MIVDQQILIARAILAADAGLSCVYHSCELVRDPDRGILGAAYRQGGEFGYVGLSDTEGFTCYIRYNGDPIATQERVGGCFAGTSLSYPLRVVFFNDREARDHAVVRERLTRLAFLPGVTLTRVVLDKFALVKQESDQLRTSFDAAVFYCAFDLLVKDVVLPDNCGQDLCRTFDNPICTP